MNAHEDGEEEHGVDASDDESVDVECAGDGVDGVGDVNGALGVEAEHEHVDRGKVHLEHGQSIRDDLHDPLVLVAVHDGIAFVAAHGVVGEGLDDGAAVVVLAAVVGVDSVDDPHVPLLLHLHHGPSW